MIASTQHHGYGSCVFEDKSSYTGDWQYGLRHGQGEYVMADGSVYRGQWAIDKPHGKGTLSIPVSKYNYTGNQPSLSLCTMLELVNFRGGWPCVIHPVTFLRSLLTLP